MMQHIVTSTGFECDVDESVLDDMEIIDDLAEIDTGNVLPFSRVLVKLLGREQKAALYDHLRTLAGRVPIEAVGTEPGSIINGLSDSKKK